jgi:hypothetical protein
MLEICASLRRSQGVGAIAAADKIEKKVGDIIAVKTQPAVWGRDEKRFFLITLLDDPVLEAELTKSVVSYPYCICTEEDDGNGMSKMKMINRSKYKIDLDMFIGSPGLDPSNMSEPVPPTGGSINPTHLVIADLILDETDRTA